MFHILKKFKHIKNSVLKKCSVLLKTHFFKDQCIVTEIFYEIQNKFHSSFKGKEPEHRHNQIKETKIPQYNKFDI